MRFKAPVISLIVAVLSQAANSDQSSPIWSARYSGPGNSVDEIRDIVVDVQGNSYVTGKSQNPQTKFDIVTIKMDPSGHTVWVKTFNGTDNGDDEGKGISLDGRSGDVVVVGNTNRSNGDVDFVTIKYDSSGNLLWKNTFQRYQHSIQNVHGVEVNKKDGSIVLMGSTSSNDGPESDVNILLVKYSSQGSIRWWNEYDTPAITGCITRDIPVGFSVDNWGYIHIAGDVTMLGVTEMGDPVRYASSLLTLMYRPEGTKIFTSTYAIEDGNYSIDSAAAMTSNFAKPLITFVSGTSKSTHSKKLSGFTTVATRRDGLRLWVKNLRMEGTENIAKIATSDQSNKVAVSGISTDISTGRERVLTVVYDGETGNTLWQAFYDRNEKVTLKDMKFDKFGNLTIVGSTKSDLNANQIFFQYNSAGVLLRDNVFDGFAGTSDYATSVYFDRAGSIYVAGASTYSPEGNLDFHTSKYSKYSKPVDQLK